MKRIKTMLSLLLALVMALSLSVTALAANGTNSNDGTITIDNAVVGQTYTVYQILKLESYNTEASAYTYKATAAWKSFVESDNIRGEYLTTDENNYVTWVEGADAAAFAKLAQAYAATLGSNQGSKKAESTTVEFTGLNLGYYLVDSTLGTLCSLDTTNPNVTIEEKNSAPQVDKEVKEDSTGDWGKVNDADIGQTVEFKATITLPVGSENVAFYDDMSAGLTLDASSIKVYTDAAMTTTLNGDYYTVTPEGTDGYTFKITFDQTYLNNLTAETKLYVYYTATVNEGAVVGTPGNPNDNWLEYGDENNTKSTPKNQTITYTWDMDVLKYANGDTSKVLEGVEFVLLNSTKDKVATVVNGKLTGWADVPTAGEDGTTTWPENTVLTTDTNGKIEIDGLDADTYYLREVKALPGYNILSDDIEVKITPTKSDDGNTLTYTTVEAKVNNQSGTELPSTGGMGTTIFYVLGAVLVIGAGVLLVTRKRVGEGE